MTALRAKEQISAPGIEAASHTISVVIPNYNHGCYLPEALDSVLGQSLPAVEVIVIDDASTDDSVAIAHAYEQAHPSVRLVRHLKNRGVIFNVNSVLPHLIGSHCMFLAADDKLRAGFFETAIRLFNQYPQAGMCLCDYEVFRNDGQSTAKRLRLANEDSYFSPQLVSRALHDTWPHGQSIVRTAALREAGGYREELRWHCDWFASWTICARHGFCYAPVCGTALRVSHESYSGRGRHSAQQREVLENLLRLLTREDFRWLRGPLRESNALTHFGANVVGILLRSPDRRYFLTVPLVTKLVRESIYSLACRLAPRALKNWVKRYVWKP